MSNNVDDINDLRRFVEIGLVHILYALAELDPSSQGEVERARQHLNEAREIMERLTPSRGPTVEDEHFYLA